VMRPDPASDVQARFENERSRAMPCELGSCRKPCSTRTDDDRLVKL